MVQRPKKFLFERSFDDPGRLYLPGERRRAEIEAAAVAAGRDPREDEVLLRALLTQKAVYEVVYEARMRPSWVVLPLAAVERLAA